MFIINIITTIIILMIFFVIILIIIIILFLQEQQKEPWQCCNRTDSLSPGLQVKYTGITAFPRNIYSFWCVETGFWNHNAQALIPL